MTDHFEPDRDHLDLTVAIIEAFVSKNSISPEALPGLIASTHAALAGLGQGDAPVDPVEDHTKSKSEIRKSITADSLISFLDGKAYKSLKRHVGTHGLTMDEYRARFGLPDDYPTVSPAYSAARSALAKSMGLGVGGRKPPKAEKPARKPKAAKAAPVSE